MSFMKSVCYWRPAGGAACLQKRGRKLLLPSIHPSTLLAPCTGAHSGHYSVQIMTEKTKITIQISRFYVFLNWTCCFLQSMFNMDVWTLIFMWKSSRQKTLNLIFKCWGLWYNLDEKRYFLSVSLLSLNKSKMPKGNLTKGIKQHVTLNLIHMFGNTSLLPELNQNRPTAKLL